MKVKQIYSLAWLSFSILAVTAFAEPTPEQQAKMKTLVAEYNAAKAQKEALDEQLKLLDKEINKLGDQIEGKPVANEIESDDDGTRATRGELAAKWFEMLKNDYNLKIRYTLEDTDENQEPALFQYTKPSDEDGSWAADVGMSLGSEFDFDRTVSWAVEGEYHYNQAASALKDSLVAGVAMAGHFGDRTRNGAGWKLDAGFKQDNLVGGEGVSASFTVMPTSRKLRLGLFPLGNNSTWLKGRLEPFLGVEFESGNGANDDFAKGERVTGRAGLSLTGWVLPKYFGERIEFQNKLSYWGHVHTSGFYDNYNENQLHFTATATYWLDTGVDKEGDLNKNFGITARYENGDNPMQSAFDLNYWTLGFAVKF